MLSSKLRAAPLLAALVVAGPVLAAGEPGKQKPAGPAAKAGRTAKLRCTVEAFERADLFPRTPGYLKSVAVDVGDRVKKGQVVAVIEVPLRRTEMKQAAALVKQAKGKVREAEAGVMVARVAVRAARAAVAQRQAEIHSARAALTARQSQYERLKSLHKQGAIDLRLVDEQERLLASARAQVAAAEAGLKRAEADKELTQVRVVRAEAAVETAQGGVEVAEAALERARVLMEAAVVRAPFDGVVTRRGYSPGDYVGRGGEAKRVPLVRVEQVDRVRVVVRVPDADAPFVLPGDAAGVVLDALPGRRFAGRVARVSAAADPRTRQLRAEIDLPNPGGLFHPGMTGTVTIRPGTATPPAPPAAPGK
jgi:multidrug efflux pump subunit AcrA (membrane-fusion protein)